MATPYMAQIGDSKLVGRTNPVGGGPGLAPALGPRVFGDDGVGSTGAES